MNTTATTTPLHPQVRQAEQLDAQGKYDDAINQLSLATRAGDVEAKLRLGKRLFSGTNSPYLPGEGVRFIAEASQQGSAEAAAVCAALIASGVSGNLDWTRALQALATAAARGWQPARQQMLLLLNPDADSIAAVSAPTDWAAAARGISLDRWLQVPAASTLHEAPLLRAFPGFVSGATCDWLIGLSTSRLQRAEVYDPHHRRNIQANTRTNSIAQFSLQDHDFLHFLLQEKMARACGVDPRQMEATAVLHYAPGEEITNHFDFVDPQTPGYADEIAQNGQRVITFLIYLNDDYADGETVFPRLDVSHKGKRGEGFYFVNCLADQTPDLRSWHAGRPPQNGDKWIVSQFIRNRPMTRLREPA